MKIRGNERLRMLYDWHTHTQYSHGRGTIEDNVKEAIAKGLSSIAITDHGPGHVFYGFRRKDIAPMREEIKEVQQLYPQIEIYMSVEANILNLSGALDIKGEEIEKFDFILAGYHFGTLGEKPGSDVVLHCRNLINGKRRSYSKELKSQNTEIVIKALYENPIRILTHPGDKGAVFIDEVAKACEDTKTLLEINTHHVELSVEAIRETAKYDVKYIVGSDAHQPQDVGTCDFAQERIRASGLDVERIVNVKVV